MKLDFLGYHEHEHEHEAQFFGISKKVNAQLRGSYKKKCKPKKFISEGRVSEERYGYKHPMERKKTEWNRGQKWRMNTRMLEVKKQVVDLERRASEERYGSLRNTNTKWRETRPDTRHKVLRNTAIRG